MLRPFSKPGFPPRVRGGWCVVRRAWRRNQSQNFCSNFSMRLSSEATFFSNSFLEYLLPKSLAIQSCTPVMLSISTQNVMEIDQSMSLSGVMRFYSIVIPDCYSTHLRESWCSY
jgi:hypothetical protein